ncbi:Glycoside hydrolase, family 28 [Dillenia turbinata]|uniref:Glycoside hydrolase, family 28 n=1 Tax=Dillenia turbinata TaxID=194707 RepID=A0AAN8WBX1_9MAGN
MDLEVSKVAVFAMYILFFALFPLNDACPRANPKSSSLNVLDFGAKADGETESSQAFSKAWDAACKTTNGIPSIMIPRGDFLVNQIILGTILAPASPSAWKVEYSPKWLTFENVNGLNIMGPGGINGQGKGWWDQSCRDHPGLALSLASCMDCSISRIHSTNSPQIHILILDSNRTKIDHVTITAPESSPNTDGIHIQSSHDITITGSTIGSGDDCVSVGDYNSDIHISDINCGPGHGISIGSLGKDGNVADVKNIFVRDVRLNGTTNGARIKTWQGGKGTVRDVIYERLKFTNVKNPIIIDQNYCDQAAPCKEQSTGVQISDVTFRDFYGTSATDMAISLICSRAVACTGIKLESINLTSAKTRRSVFSNCINAHGTIVGHVEPRECLKK